MRRLRPRPIQVACWGGAKGSPAVIGVSAVHFGLQLIFY
jgi:hypothetical protein